MSWRNHNTMSTTKSTPKQQGIAFTAASPKTMPCSCRSEFQDARYGAGMRLKNPTKEGHRCTVCGEVVKRS